MIAPSSHRLWNPVATTRRHAAHPDGSAEAVRRDQADAPAAKGPTANVGSVERVASALAGALLLSLGIQRRTLPGLALAGLGGALIHRGASGHCPVYGALGLDTRGATAAGGAEEQVAARGIHAEQALLINRPAGELYRFWRDFAQLPRFMRHLERVEVLEGGRSRWVTKAPSLAGGHIAWEAEITRDEPGVAIAWRSLPGSAVVTVGEIRFAPALGDRGTEVHVALEYVPPAGHVGHWVATLSGEGPQRQLRDDLRAFKQLIELGEVSTIAGQPRGTCMGHGTNERDG